MPSSFFELSVASTGLFTSKGAINVVGNNIANAETKGYSRQVALIRARTPLNYQNGRGMIGTGSELYGIGQVRNFYLDTKYWTNTGILGEYSAKSTQNRLIQATLNETDETGFNASINNLFSVINRDWSTDPSSATARLAVTNTAQALTQYFNTTYTNLQKQQSDINLEIKGVVSTINNLGLQLQNLNKQIFTSELDGTIANDLRDSRALIVDELSKYVNVEVRELEVNKDLLTGKSEKRFQVSINGYDFVSHFDLNTLNCVERTVKNNPEDVEGLCDIFWTNGVKFNSEYSLNTMSGELKGLLVTRDGNNQNYPSSTIKNTATNSYGGTTLTFSTTDSSRNDWPISGNITIDGKVYAYDNYKCIYTYDQTTDTYIGTMTIDIPPQSGKMTVGTTVVSYSGLQISGSDITFTIEGEPKPSKNEIAKRIKIGDMVLDGNASIDPVTGLVTIPQSSAAFNIQNITAGSTTKVGNSVDYKGLPYFMSKLNTFVRGLALSFNLGRDAHGNKIEGATGHYDAYNRIEGANTGYNFFTYTDNPNSPIAGYGIEYLDYHTMTAGNFSVSKELLADPDALAAALSASADPDDGTAILNYIGLVHNPNVFDEGEYGNFVQSIIGELGIITNEGLSFESNYTDITASIENQRLSVSSVSLDEEMTTLVYLQQIYNACAKLIQTLNGIYDTTINMVR